MNQDLKKANNVDMKPGPVWPDSIRDLFFYFGQIDPARPA
jgi:hypothetical protein